MQSGRQRVATAVGIDGATHELLLSKGMVDEWQKVRLIRGHRDEHFSSARDLLATWISNRPANSLPYWMTTGAANIDQWRSSQRLSQLVFDWDVTHNGCDGDEEIRHVLVEWRKREEHLYQYESNLRDQLLVQRKNLYREWVAMLRRRYAVAHEEKMDLRAAIHDTLRPEEEQEVESPQRAAAAFASLSQLRGFLGAEPELRKLKHARLLACVDTFASNRHILLRCGDWGALSLSWPTMLDARQSQIGLGLSLASAGRLSAGHSDAAFSFSCNEVHHENVASGPVPGRRSLGLLAQRVIRWLFGWLVPAFSGRQVQGGRRASRAGEACSATARASVPALLGLWLISAAVLLADDRSPPSLVVAGVTLYRVDSPIVHDADTLSDGVIRLPFGSAVAGRKIRADYDAWEVTRARGTVKVTPEEIELGKKATADLRELLRDGTLYVCPIPPKEDIDPYDRVDARWYYRTSAGLVAPMKDFAKDRGWLRSGK